MALTSETLDALDTAIATGVLEVEGPDGRRVKYNSIKDLLAARNAVAFSLANATRITKANFRYDS